MYSMTQHTAQDISPQLDCSSCAKLEQTVLLDNGSDNWAPPDKLETPAKCTKLALVQETFRKCERSSG